MCDKCQAIDKRIIQLKMLARNVDDHQATSAVDGMITGLQDQKTALHPIEN